MDTVQNFRTAVGGFNKSDVALYITKTAKEHKAALAEKDQQIAALQQEVAQLEAELCALREAQEAAVESNTAAPDEPQGEKHPFDLKMLDQFLSVDSPVVSAPVPTPFSTGTLSSTEQLELAAYRRAEAAERLANQRAQKIYQEIDTICSGTTVTISDVSEEALSSLDNIHQQIVHIEDLYSGLTNTMQQASEKLSALGATVPDPAETMEV